MNRHIIGLLLLVATGAANGQQPLFESADTLALTIEAPMRTLIAKRRDKPEFDAVVSYVSNSGETRSLPARITSRGNARLETCDFPPIRIEFDPDAAIAREYGVEAMPSSFVFGRNGELVARHLGFKVKKQNEYEALLVKTLGDTP